MGTAGEHTLYIQIDEANNISESSETNNITSKTITVTQSLPEITATNPVNNSAGIPISLAPTITFSESMDEDSLNTNTITLTAIADNLGNKISTPLEGSVSYNAASHQATWSPAAPFANNYTYNLSISVEVQDAYGHNIAEEKNIVFTTIMNRDHAQVYKGSDGKTQVYIEHDSIAYDNFFIMIQTNPDQTDAIYKATQKVSNEHINPHKPIPETLRSFHIYIDENVELSDEQINFAAPVTITIPYTDNGDGMVSGTNPQIQESSLAMYWLNETDNLWVKLPHSQVNQTEDNVTAEVPHFSHFMLIGAQSTSLAGAYAYPVPYKPNSDPTHTSIKFTGLSTRATIKIYTISGELVAKIVETDGDGFNDTWNAQEVSSGMYIYYIENEQEQKTGQLLIIK
ncbi:MAG: Ig-like domain-containing protein [bacterium]